jgi:Bacterial Ig domain
MPRASQPLVTARRLAGALSLVTALTLAGCGGGVYIGIDGSSDSPPDVQLSVTQSANNNVTLRADAWDDYAVRSVQFWYDDGVSPTSLLLYEDHSWPYEVATNIPRTPSGRVSYLARAIDDAGQTASTGWTTVLRQ